MTRKQSGNDISSFESKVEGGKKKPTENKKKSLAARVLCQDE